MEKFSDKAINRLTLYHCILADFQDREIPYISCGQFAKLLKIDDSEVRKDISLLSNLGKNNNEYPVRELKTTIEKTLGFAKNKKAFIVGAGNLGLALAKYDDFKSYGLNILALFDNDRKKIGTTVNNKVILDISKLPNLAKKSEVDIAILTVPKKYAQVMADFLVASGIKYIWNFAPVVLCVPDNVQVWNENIMGNLLQFTYDI